jgi:hypothetical protein
MPKDNDEAAVAELLSPNLRQLVITDLLPLLLPKLVVSASMPPSNCTKITYTVTLTPGLALSSVSGPHDRPYRFVAVQAFDHKDRPLPPQMVPLDGDGDTASNEVSWPLPDDAGPFDSDWTGTATLVANPRNLALPDGSRTSNPFHFATRQTSVTSVAVQGTCIG